MSFLKRRLWEPALKWAHTTTGKWVAVSSVFALVAATFHLMFLVLGGVIGLVTGVVTVLGGYVLGPWQGMLYAGITSILSIPLWTREYGWSLAENISGFFVSVLLAFGAGWIQRMVRHSREQTLALKRSNEALQNTQMQLLQAEKLMLFGEIAAGVAHEMNQPLAIIGLAAQLGKRNLRAGNTEDLADQLTTINAQVQRGAQIIRRLKSTGRDSGGQQRRDCSLNEIARDAAIQFQPQFQALGIDLQVQLGAALPPVFASQSQIEQMLSCLLLNARDAVNNTDKRRVFIRTLESQERLALEVEDTGTGIPREVMPRIFDPFFTTKEVGAGSGLGLPICHRIASDHGGTIDVRSVEGQGTCFTVQLPRAAAPTEPVTFRAPPKTHSQSAAPGDAPAAAGEPVPESGGPPLV